MKKFAYLFFILAMGNVLSAQSQTVGVQLDFRNIGDQSFKPNFQGTINYNIDVSSWQIGLSYTKRKGNTEHYFQCNIPQFKVSNNTRAIAERPNSTLPSTTISMVGDSRFINFNAYYAISRIINYQKWNLGVGINVNPNYTYFEFNNSRFDSENIFAEGLGQEINYHKSSILFGLRTNITYQLSNRFSLQVNASWSFAEVYTIYKETYGLVILGSDSDRSTISTFDAQSNLTPTFGLSLHYSLGKSGEN